MKKFILVFLITLTVTLSGVLKINPIHGSIVHADSVTKSLNPTLTTKKRALGVSKIEYSGWNNYNSISTRAKRVSLTVASISVSGLATSIALIGKYINAGIIAFSLTSAYCVQGKSIGDVWPHYSVRNILGYTKAHYWEIIGQETNLTLYGNSTHTFSKAHAHYYLWVR